MLQAVSNLAQYDYYYDINPYSVTTTAAGFSVVSILLVCCCIIAGFAISALIGYLIYKDAVKHNIDNPALWGILSAITWIAALIYVLAIRNQATGSTAAPAAEKPADKEE